MEASKNVDTNRIVGSTVINVPQEEDNSVKIGDDGVVVHIDKKLPEDEGAVNELENDDDHVTGSSTNLSTTWTPAADGDQVENMDGEPILYSVDVKEPPKPLTCCGRFRAFVNRTKGITAALLCSLQLAICTYLARWLITTRDYDASHCLIVRFTGAVIFSIFILAYAQLKQKKAVMTPIWPLCPGGKKCDKTKSCNFLKLMARSIFGCAAIISQVYALVYITSAEATVIMFTNPVFVGLGAWIILKEKCGIIPTIMAILAILGVIIAVNPPFIAGSDKFTTSKLIGIGLAAAAMFLTVVTMIIIRLLKFMHFSIMTAGFGVVGLLAAIIMGASTNKFSRSMDKVDARDGPMAVTAYDCFLFLVLAALSALGLIFNTLALYWEQAGAVAIVRSSEIIFALLLQLSTNDPPVPASYGGTAIVIFCISVIGFRQYLMSMRDGHKCKKKLWFLLK